ncbi:MAG TPA: iron donor protein CyaY [Acidobacteriota bacterium]|nr:iron donor protein CyaY [Acidobacteriota bacterium]
MMDEHDFQEKAGRTLEDLEKRILPIADEHEFEVESGGGMLTLVFEEPAPSKFILSPNSPARQIWVSALSTSFKFDWDPSSDTFVLDKSREPIRQVIARLLGKQLGSDIQL